jgi:hypothetical protein
MYCSSYFTAKARNWTTEQGFRGSFCGYPKDRGNFSQIMLSSDKFLFVWVLKARIQPPGHCSPPVSQLGVCSANQSSRNTGQYDAFSNSPNLFDLRRLSFEHAFGPSPPGHPYRQGWSQFKHTCTRTYWVSRSYDRATLDSLSILGLVRGKEDVAG